MRSLNLVFVGVAAVGMAAGAYAQTTPNPTTKPASTTGSKPAGQLGNSGGGLGMNMTPSQARRAFRNLDSNSDGYLSRTELMQNGDSGQRFPGCDANHDGKLSQAEYVQCSQRPATTQDQHR